MDDLSANKSPMSSEAVNTVSTVDTLLINSLFYEKWWAGIFPKNKNLIKKKIFFKVYWISCHFTGRVCGVWGFISETDHFSSNQLKQVTFNNDCVIEFCFFFQIFQTNFSNKFFKQIFQTNFSNKFFKQIFQTNFSNKFFGQIFQTNFSDRLQSQNDRSVSRIYLLSTVISVIRQTLISSTHHHERLALQKTNKHPSNLPTQNDFKNELGTFFFYLSLRFYKIVLEIFQDFPLLSSYTECLQTSSARFAGSLTTERDSGCSLLRTYPDFEHTARRHRGGGGFCGVWYV